MKLAKLQLKDDSLVTTYPSRVLTSDRYELRADFEARVAWVDGDFIPFELVARATPQATAETKEILTEIAAASRLVEMPVVKCERCTAEFASAQALGGHRRHCKGM